MPTAIRAITRIQDADDAPALGAGQNGYALTWNNATGAFVATELVVDHGALTGLGDDDHTGYTLLAGRNGGQTLYGDTAANGDITIHGTSNATRTTSSVILQPTGGNVGVGEANENAKLNISATSRYDDGAVTALMVSSNIAGETAKNIRIGYDSFNTNDFAYIQAAETGAGSKSLVLQGSGGNLGVGIITPATKIHGLLTSSATNAVTNVVTIGHDTSGTAAAGFGAAIALQLESSTTAAQSAALISALWNEATDATRKADLVLSAYDTAAREGLRIRGAGSAAAIGFLGATPAARIAHVADPTGGGTVDAEARTAINSILATLETFGLHATS